LTATQFIHPDKAYASLNCQPQNTTYEGGGALFVLYIKEWRWILPNKSLYWPLLRPMEIDHLFGKHIILVKFKGFVESPYAPAYIWLQCHYQ